MDTNTSCGFFDSLGKHVRPLALLDVDDFMSTEHLIVGATGVGYLVVGVLQWSKGEISNGMIWTGYAFAQVGLWLNIK
jgi:hypothetical protein